MNNTLAEAIWKCLSTPQSIVIVGHRNPDGDAIGACLGLYHFLKQINIESTVIMPDDFPAFLKWMPESDQVLNYEQHTAKVTEAINQATLIFTLDFNSLQRLGSMAPLLEASSAKFIMIDHHEAPDNYAAITYSDTAICATSQMVFHLIESLEKTEYLNPAIASCLYTGIMTDTGSFKYFNTTATTHRVAAQLIEAGAPNAEIHQNVYNTQTLNRLKLLGKAIENLTVLPHLNTAYITMSTREMQKFNYQKGDTEGFVNYALSIKNIRLAVFLKEDASLGITKLSLRSHRNFSVNQMARAHFNGGGHTNAAGGKLELSLEDAVAKFISILPAYKSELE